LAEPSEEQNVELARAAYEAWGRGDVDRFVELFSEDVEVHPFLGRGLGASTYHGHSGLREWYADANEPWEELKVHPHEFRPVGKHVVIFLKAVGRGRGSHAQVEAEIVHVAEFRDGKAVRLDGYGDREQALQALGISE
jgi:ketosteroid isomerase-like protein